MITEAETEGFSLPFDWELSTLGKLADQERGITYGIVQPGQHTIDGVPIIRVQNIVDGTLDTSDIMRVAPEIAARYRRTCLRGGELLLSLVGSVGSSVIAPKEIAGWNTARAVAVVPLQPGVDARYVRFCLRSPPLQHWMEVWCNTTVQATLNLSDVARLPIPIPPKREREAIVEVLAALEDKIELNRRMNRTLEELAAALFRSWFVDFDPVVAKAAGLKPAHLRPDLAALFHSHFQDSSLGPIPHGWRVNRVEELVERIRVGKKYERKTALPIGRVPILDQGRSGVIGYHNDDPGVTASFEEPVAVFANHTCYSRLVTYPFSAIQNVLPFKGKGVSTIWLFHATDGLQEFIEYKGHWPDLMDKKIVVPSGKLDLRFEEAVFPLIKLIRHNERESQTLAALRDILLPKLLSGELRVRQAEELIVAAT
jgi:type I restriction enzyme, S subunit